MKKEEKGEQSLKKIEKELKLKPKKPNYQIVREPIQWKTVCWYCKKSGKGITLYKTERKNVYACQEHKDIKEIPVLNVSSREPIAYKHRIVQLK